jgi:hypothetical protein
MMSDPEPNPVPSLLTCFVIGPIGNRHGAHGTAERQTYEESLRIMGEVIEPACARFGLAAVRADSLARAGEINEQIFKRLRDDDVVIADLTGANANVMYELGLRHTRDKLTVQIGEYGRLPFDVNMIRTIQFSRSEVGLINARDELIEVLEAGIVGEFDPVSATRVWTGEAQVADVTGAQEEMGAADEASGDADDRGFLDIMAEAEEQQERLAPALEVVGQSVAELGELAEASTAALGRSDAAGKGMRGRLQIATKYARGLDVIADRLESSVDDYASVLGSVSDGTMALIESMAENPDNLADGQEFGMIARRTASMTRESMASLAEMVASMNANARLSRVLREPSRRLTAALDRFASATSTVDEWDRRLQSLGVPVPPEDWEPDFADDESDGGESGGAGQDGPTDDHADGSGESEDQEPPAAA